MGGVKQNKNILRAKRREDETQRNEIEVSKTSAEQCLQNFFIKISVRCNESKNTDMN